MNYLELKRHLQEAIRSKNDAVLSGLLPDYASYCLATGESRGLNAALEILEELYNHEEENNNV